VPGKLDLARAASQGAEALERYRRRKAEQKRAQRARRRAKGLTARGRPVKNPERQMRFLTFHGHHPQDCPCYDCLWGDKRDPLTGRVVRENYTPRVCGVYAPPP